jgi:hypothetical protein
MIERLVSVCMEFYRESERFITAQRNIKRFLFDKILEVTAFQPLRVKNFKFDIQLKYVTKIHLGIDLCRRNRKCQELNIEVVEMNMTDPGHLVFQYPD